MRIEDIAELLNLRILNKGRSFKINSGVTFVYIEGVPVTPPEVMRVLKRYIRDGLRLMENKTKGGNFYVKSKGPKNS